LRARVQVALSQKSGVARKVHVGIQFRLAGKAAGHLQGHHEAPAIGLGQIDTGPCPEDFDGMCHRTLAALIALAIVVYLSLPQCIGRLSENLVRRCHSLRTLSTYLSVAGSTFRM